ncbi:hypothetical protein GGR57DRAFT_161753 [Xylariaceae sp. FL1272]|nr:hypothetical protein GGR57DRAFT_161753 [Xylariaceae sp. FL1272]
MFGYVKKIERGEEHDLGIYPNFDRKTGPGSHSRRTPSDWQKYDYTVTGFVTYDERREQWYISSVVRRSNLKGACYLLRNSSSRGLCRCRRHLSKVALFNGQPDRFRCNVNSQLKNIAGTLSRGPVVVKAAYLLTLDKYASVLYFPRSLCLEISVSGSWSFFGRGTGAQLVTAEGRKSVIGSLSYISQNLQCASIFVELETNRG